MNKLFTFVLALLFAGNLMAAKQVDEYQMETYTSSRIAYNMLLNGMEIIQTCVGCRTQVITHQELAICWPFPIEWEVFYRTIQDRVNEDVLSYPRREQGRLGPTIGWKVWNAMQDEWGC